jgi:hypothetical protein
MIEKAPAEKPSPEKKGETDIQKEPAGKPPADSKTGTDKSPESFKGKMDQVIRCPVYKDTGENDSPVILEHGCCALTQTKMFQEYDSTKLYLLVFQYLVLKIF